MLLPATLSNLYLLIKLKVAWLWVSARDIPHNHTHHVTPGINWWNSWCHGKALSERTSLLMNDWWSWVCVCVCVAKLWMARQPDSIPHFPLSKQQNGTVSMSYGNNENNSSESYHRSPNGVVFFPQKRYVSPPIYPINPHELPKPVHKQMVL